MREKTTTRDSNASTGLGETFDDGARSSLEDEDTAALVDEAALAAAAADWEAEAQRAAQTEAADPESGIVTAADALADAELDELTRSELLAEETTAGAEGDDLALADAELLAEAMAADAEGDDLAKADAELREALADDEPLDEEAQAQADSALAQELSDEEPTAEEEALAQAEAEIDPDAELGPAEIEEVDEEIGGSLEKLAAKARRLGEDEARHAIHSLLFVADKPLTVEQLRNNTGLEPARIRASLDRLAGELREGISGVILSEVAGGWQLRTAPESAEFVRRFLQIKPRRLTRAALETLAIVAYRQPVTRPEIEEIRGVDCGAVVKALLDWKLLKILGKKEEVGRPLLYGTSKEFLEFFQIKDLGSLPSLREFQELNEESRQIVEEELGPEAVAEIAGTVAALADPAYALAEQERILRSEAALADLEKAMADAEEASAEVASGLDPSKAAKPRSDAPDDEAAGEHVEASAPPASRGRRSAKEEVSLDASASAPEEVSIEAYAFASLDPHRAEGERVDSLPDDPAEEGSH